MDPISLYPCLPHTFVHLHSLTPEWDPISLYPCLPLPLSIYTVWSQNGTLSACTPICPTFVHLQSLTPEWDPISLYPCLPYLCPSTKFDPRIGPYKSVPLFAPTFVHRHSLTPELDPISLYPLFAPTFVHLHSLTPEWDPISRYPSLPLPLSIYKVWPQNGTLSAYTPVCPYLCPSIKFNPRIEPYQPIPLFAPTFVHL